MFPNRLKLILMPQQAGIQVLVQELCTGIIWVKSWLLQQNFCVMNMIQKQQNVWLLDGLYCWQHNFCFSLYVLNQTVKLWFKRGKKKPIILYMGTILQDCELIPQNGYRPLLTYVNRRCNMVADKLADLAFILRIGSRLKRFLISLSLLQMLMYLVYSHILNNVW